MNLFLRMEEAVFMSICIQAYKRVSFLERLPDSKEIQTERQFEVMSPTPSFSQHRLFRGRSGNQAGI
jgi:hypothetical protein